MDDIRVRRMADTEIGEASELVSLAFLGNPSTLAVVCGDPERARKMMEAGARFAKLGRRCSHVLVAERAGRVVGVLNAALWPDCQMGIGDTLRTASAMIRAMGPALPRALKLMRTRARHDPRRRHWHLGPIGVHPDFQGRGVGKAMLSSFLARVDEEGVPAFLETDVEANVRLYRKFGFEIIAREDILGVDNRFMWRHGATDSERRDQSLDGAGSAGGAEGGASAGGGGGAASSGGG